MQYAVFVIDCIKSKNNKVAMEGLNNRVEGLNHDALRNKNILVPFTLLRGDEIEGVVKVNQDLHKNIRYIREACYPMMIRIGIGIGAIDGFQEMDCKKSNPWELNGQAFHLGRKAVNAIGESKAFRKKPVSMLMSNNKELDELINLTLPLYDFALKRWNDKVYNAVYLYEKYEVFSNIDLQEAGVSASALINRVSRADWSLIKVYEERMSSILSRLIKES